jgi:hypothetical protein
VSKEFLAEFSRPEKSVQYAVDAAISKFPEHTHAGLHLEKLQNSRDPRVRTIRIDRFWRGVVIAPDAGDTYCLMTVLPHDKAIAYATNLRFSVNEVIGVFEVRDEGAPAGLRLDVLRPGTSDGRSGNREDRHRPAPRYVPGGPAGGTRWRRDAAVDPADEFHPESRRLPRRVTGADVDEVSHQQDLLRERCVLFVACTRARDHLYISYAGGPSQFLPMKGRGDRPD